ncbi:MAG: hypothetical protein ACXAC8_16345 [Candidatus Hodarchaeales archaeon]|jgi:hypothetical protein
MKAPLKMVLISIAGWMIVIIGIFIISLLGLADPFLALQEVFSRNDVSVIYNFEAFGIIFKLWAISALIPISGLNLLISPLLIESLFPIFILLIISIGTGYLLGIKKGIPINVLLLVWGTIFGILLAVLIPFTLPTAGIAPEDIAAIQGLSGDLVRLTFLIPPNLLTDAALTLGLCLGSVVIGGLGQRIISPDKAKARMQKKRKKR